MLTFILLDEGEVVKGRLTVDLLLGSESKGGVFNRL